MLVVAFATSTVWVVLVRKVVIGDSIADVIAYACGSTLGVVLAKDIHTKGFLLINIKRASERGQKD